MRPANPVVIFISIIFIMSMSGCGLFIEYEDLRGPGDNSGSLLDSGHPDAFEAGNVSTCKVTEAIDGDTLVLEGGERVRLLGINAPEYDTYFYREAGDVLKLLVEGKEVVLEKDVTDRDMYGRLLRYVYLGEIFVNLEMVKRGFANSFSCPPDIRFAEDFLEAERYSRENNLGLWERSKTGRVKIDIHYDAPGNDNENLNGEYVLIENKSGTLLNTMGWTVKDSATNAFQFNSFDFASGTIIRLFSGEGIEGEGLFYWNSPRPVWNNDHDTLYLRDRKGLLIDIYNY
ncbi:MAG: thermonuclease family protein [Actinobacteria bacterium]|nr:thermonuclease family protein [Actinomycetota bacterium]